MLPAVQALWVGLHSHVPARRAEEGKDPSGSQIPGGKNNRGETPPIAMMERGRVGDRPHPLLGRENAKASLPLS